MKELTTKGIIISEELSSRHIESGTIALVNVNSKYYRITTIHLNQEGNWMVEGDYNGEINSMKGFKKLSALCNGENYPINLKDYKYIIKKDLIGDQKFHEFLITPHKFKEGVHELECTQCYAQFIGGPRQPYCKKCCRIIANAKLIRK